MMFFTQLFTSKRGPLAKIWLAAHWERKLTKAHVFECNLEVTIRDIMSPKMKIGLRTSGHLLLGVVRIYSKKTKYLLADCSDALVKIRMAFRPDQTDLPAEGLEATIKAITLDEDFTAFDTPLPLPSDIDVDYLSLNQCRSEEITLKEDFGHQFLSFQDSGNESQSQAKTLLDRRIDSFAQDEDGFGDEGMEFNLLDFLTERRDPAEPSYFILEEPQHEHKESSPTNDDQHRMDVDSREPMETEASAINETTLLTNNWDAFVLEPVPITSNSERKIGKRKRKLVVDQTKELSSKFIKEQISYYFDLMAPLDIAPPTVKLMEWMESRDVNKLFSNPCSSVVNPHLKELFAKSVFQVNVCNIGWEVEQIRQEEQEAQRNVSAISTSNVNVADSSLDTENTHSPDLTAFDPMNDHQETYSEVPPNENSIEFSHPELPSEDSMFVHPSNVEQYTQSTSLHTQSQLGSQDAEERRVTKKALKLLKYLQRRQTARDPTFSLRSLCEGSTRAQAATNFFYLLVLKKQDMVMLHQLGPYQDISVTPGPKYYA